MFVSGKPVRDHVLVSGAVQRELISVASPQPTSTHVGHIWEVDKKFCICKWEKMGMKTCAKTLSEIQIFFTLTSWDTADVRWPITLCWTLIWCLLFRSDPADPLPTDQQEEVEGLQDPCLHWRQDQQDWSWPPSVCTALSSHSEGPPGVGGKGEKTKMVFLKCVLYCITISICAQALLIFLNYVTSF